jgi:hypothetical protein
MGSGFQFNLVQSRPVLPSSPAWFWGPVISLPPIRVGFLRPWLQSSEKPNGPDGSKDLVLGADLDLLGFRVAISKDIVLAGAENRASGGNPAVGAAYVLESREGDSSEAELLASDGTSSAQFGCSTAVNADTLLVGAGGQTTVTGQGAGEAYTYQFQSDRR